MRCSRLFSPEMFPPFLTGTFAVEHFITSSILRNHLGIYLQTPPGEMYKEVFAAIHDVWIEKQSPLNDTLSPFFNIETIA